MTILIVYSSTDNTSVPSVKLLDIFYVAPEDKHKVVTREKEKIKCEFILKEIKSFNSSVVLQLSTSPTFSSGNWVGSG